MDFIKNNNFHVHKSWNNLFKRYEIQIDDDEEIFPPKELVFKVFEMDVKKIKLVLLGQDCYHDENQAHGLSFSVPKGVKIPPSLQNIFKELKRSFPERKYEFTHGNLENWFYNEHIFLLNCALTVVPHFAGSHLKIWRQFTNDVIKYICKKNKNCLFLLLGNFAKSKSEFITNKNNIIEATHPSPLAASSSEPFIGSDVFKRVEEKLGCEINWQN